MKKMLGNKRILIAAGGIGMMIPGTVSDLAGLGVVALITVIQYITAKNSKTPLAV